MKGKMLKKLIALGLLVYVCFVFVSQQSDLSAYKKQCDYYEKQIATEYKNKEELLKHKGDVESDEFIEQIAREKLKLYKPNEVVYIEVGK